MTLSFEDAERLQNAGFIPYEIEEFSSAITSDGQLQPPIDLNSPVWTAVIKSRNDWLIDKITRGWSQDEIENSIMSYYAAKRERSPWDFLRAEYHPPTKIDYKSAIRRRAQSTTAELKRY
ncbi:MAG TPA: hypothetical protein ENI23_02610 [bacterium]|nr:hypothetical protein [bacterium]